ncbi:hypothetical protein AAD001_16010 [Colwelliaceae bacterium 6471]
MNKSIFAECYILAIHAGLEKSRVMFWLEAAKKLGLTKSEYIYTLGYINHFLDAQPKNYEMTGQEHVMNLYAVLRTPENYKKAKEVLALTSEQLTQILETKSIIRDCHEEPECESFEKNKTAHASYLDWKEDCRISSMEMADNTFKSTSVSHDENYNFDGEEF